MFVYLKSIFVVFCDKISNFQQQIFEIYVGENEYLLQNWFLAP